MCVKDRLRFRVNLENGEISCIINIERKETRLVRILLISGAQFPRIDSVCILQKLSIRVIRNRPIFFFSRFVGQALSRTNCSRVIYLWRVYDGHMHALYTRKKYFLTSATFPSLFLFTTSLMTRPLRERYRRTKLKMIFFFCPRNVFPSSLPPHVSHRTRRNNCAGKTGNNSFLRTSLSANFHPTARTGPFSWNTATNLPEHQVKIKPPNCLIHDCSVDPPSSSIFYSIKRRALWRPRRCSLRGSIPSSLSRESREKNPERRCTRSPDATINKTGQ